MAKPAVKTTVGGGAVAVLLIAFWNAWDSRPFPMNGVEASAFTAVVTTFTAPLVRKWTKWLDE